MTQLRITCVTTYRERDNLEDGEHWKRSIVYVHWATETWTGELLRTSALALLVAGDVGGPGEGQCGQEEEEEEAQRGWKRGHGLVLSGSELWRE